MPFEGHLIQYALAQQLVRQRVQLPRVRSPRLVRQQRSDIAPTRRGGVLVDVIHVIAQCL
jgi:hypothetical protein